MSFERTLSIREKETAVAKGRLKALEIFDKGNNDAQYLLSEFRSVMNSTIQLLDNFHPDYFSNPDNFELNRKNDLKPDSALKPMLLEAFKAVRVLSEIAIVLEDRGIFPNTKSEAKSFEAILIQAETVYRTNGQQRHCHPHELDVA